jgi:hypothetical protein
MTLYLAWVQYGNQVLHSDTLRDPSMTLAPSLLYFPVCPLTFVQRASLRQQFQSRARVGEAVEVNLRPSSQVREWFARPLGGQGTLYANKPHLHVLFLPVGTQ